MVYTSFTHTCGECGRVILKKEGDANGNLPELCSVCENTFGNASMRGSVTSVRLPGEHHKHGLHFGVDATAARKKTAAKRYQRSVALDLPPLGTRVVISVRSPDADALIGTVRYSGKTVFAGGDWVGIELDEPHGKNSGSVLGCRYFSCNPDTGLFVRPDQIIAKGEKAELIYQEEQRIRQKRKKDVGGKKDVDKTKLTGEHVASFHHLFNSLPEVGARLQGKADGKRYAGEVRFVGTTKFAGGQWVGLCLDLAVGKNSGIVNGVKYFDCPPRHGLFLRPDACLIPYKGQQSDERLNEGDLELDAKVDLDRMSADELRDMVEMMQYDREEMQSEMDRLRNESLDLATSYEEQFRSARASVSVRGEAAVKLQSTWRGKRDRKKVSTWKEQRAATKIQSIQRGKKDRENIKVRKKLKEEQTNAATAIQARVRGRAVRNAMAQQKRIGDISPSSLEFKLYLVALFHALDRNGSGRVYATELHRLAMAMGYPDRQAEAFYPQYEAICSYYDCPDDDGLTVRAFTMLLGTSDGDFDMFYVSSAEELNKLQVEFGVASQVIRQKDEASVTGRKARLEAICKAADADGDEHLNKAELLRVLVTLGLSIQRQFNEMYEALCEELVLDPLRGMPIREMAANMNTPGGPYFLYETMLSDFDKEFGLEFESKTSEPGEAVELSRNERLDLLFDSYDSVESGGRLRSTEMYPFAQVLGFPGSLADFEGEYKTLCEEYKIDVGKGFDRQAFKQVANVQTGDLFIEDEVLKECISKLGIATVSPRGTDAGPEVSVSFAVNNIDYKILSANANLLSAVTTSLKESIAREARNGIKAGQVKLQLSDGSLLVDAKIAVTMSDPNKPTADLIKSSLETSKTFSEGLVASLRSIRGMNSVTTGAVTVSDLKVSQSDSVRPSEASGSTLRADQLADLFKALDVQKTEKLKLEEMYSYAQKLGFPGPLSEFEDEYKELCQFYKCDTTSGLDFRFFQQVANYEDGNFYVDDATLQSLLLDLVGFVPTQSAKPTNGPRTDQLIALFGVLDTQQIGRLRSPELYIVARKLGFPGSEREFAKDDYPDLCQESEIDAKVGLNLEAFQQVCNSTDGNLYLEDDLVDELLREQGLNLTQPAKPMPLDTRENRILALYNALDTDKENMLIGGELFAFARKLGYPEGKKEFEEEYDRICDDYQYDDRCNGLDTITFMRMVNDEEGNYYCTEDFLDSLLEDFGVTALAGNDTSAPLDANMDSKPDEPEMPEPAKDAGPTGPASEPGEAESKSSAVTLPTATVTENSQLVLARAETTKALFNALDKDQDGRLVNEELFAFAVAMGYPPDDKTMWAEEYQDLCNTSKCDIKTGLDVKAFEQIINDTQEDNNFYCDDGNMKSIIETLSSSVRAAAPVTEQARRFSMQFESRADCIAEIFRVADRNNDGFVDSAEMYPFAKMCGFPNPLADFSPEFEELCVSVKCDPRKGLDAEVFTQLAQDQEGDYFIEDDDIENVLKELAQNNDSENPEVEAPSAADAPSAARVELFKVADQNGDGLIDSSEMYPFAKMHGYPNPEAEFYSDFEELCSGLNCDPRKGLDDKVFARLTEDPDGDYYIEDDNLASFSEAFAKELNVSKAEDPPKEEMPSESLQDLFKAVDGNADGFADCSEMFQVAQLCGYPDTEKAYAENDWVDLCKDNEIDPKKGLDVKLFAALVQDEDSTYFIESDQLASFTREFVTKRSGGNDVGQPAEAQNPQGPESVAQGESEFRAEVVQEIFRVADQNNDSLLDCSEMFRIAQTCGFPESEKEFAPEWEKLCESIKCDSKVGIDAKSFAAILGDVDGDYFQADDDLKPFLSDLTNLKPVLDKRMELLEGLFKIADQNRDGRVDSSEMLALAQVIGFPDGQKEFAPIWEDICVELECDPRVGLDAKLLAKLTGDTERDFYIETEELPSHAKELQKRCDEAQAAVKIQAVARGKQGRKVVAEKTNAAAEKKSEPTARAKALKELFTFADRNSDGLLDSAEMFQIAQLLGFDQPEAAFDPEWEDLCKSLSCNTQTGLDDKSFARLVDDTAGNYFIEDADMPSILQGLSSKVKKRQELLQAIFVSLDVSKKELLSQQELFRYAKLLGFPEGIQEFAEEYTTLCNDFKVDPTTGFDEAAFLKLANDKSQDYYIEDGQAAALQAELNSATVEDAPATQAADAEASKPVSKRAELISVMFKVLDVDKNGRLLSDEVFAFAAALGFPGEAQQFREEYEVICQNSSVDTKIGLDENTFAQVVSDGTEDDNDYFCEDERLENVLAQLQQQSSATAGGGESQAPPQLNTRAEYTAAIFQALDRDRDGLIKCSEFFKFAVMKGWEESEANFEDEWKELCSDHNVDDSRGFDIEVFGKFTSDPESPYEIEDEELALCLKECAKD